MAAWVDCSGTDSYFRGFAADLGPYIGPNPPGAPGTIEGQSEVDFYVLLPNPLDPTDVTIAGDGTYATSLWGTYRFDNSPFTPPTMANMFLDSLGGAPYPVAATAIPPGAHIYVSVDDDAPHPPGFYVPVDYAAAGTATVKTAPGQWSAWQTGPAVTHAAVHAWASGFFALGAAPDESPASYTAAEGAEQRKIVSDAAYPVWPVAPFSDILADAQASADAALLTPETGGDRKGFLWTIEQMITADFHPFEPVLKYSETVGLALQRVQSRDGWRASTQLDAVGTDLVFGLDYSDPPFADEAPYFASGGFWHEAPTPTPVWLDVENYLLTATTQIRISGDSPSSVLTQGDVKVYVGVPPIIDLNGVSYGPDVIDGPSALWIDPGASGLALVETPTAIAGATLPSGLTSQSLDAVPLPLSDESVIPAGSFYVTVLWEGQLPELSSPPVDPPIPTLGDSHGTGGEIASVAHLNPAALYTDPVRFWFPFADTIGIPYVADNPRWRYWVPGAIVPAGAPSSYLRMTQRDDGSGIARHPRLPVLNAATSRQSAHAPRVGDHNTYS